MDPGRSRADSGTIEYYLNRLIQRAIVEPKPLLKIYEEECQRHSDISVTVTFKEFQAALQKHCMTLQSRNQHVPAAVLQARHHELNYQNKEHGSKFAPTGNNYFDQAKKRRRSETQPSQPYHRLPHSVLERFSPQVNQMNYRNGPQQVSVPPTQHPVKAEERLYTSPPAPQPPPHTLSRPPSVQLPLEEESPPEFIEMSSNPPRLLDSNFSSMNIYQNQVTGERNTSPATDGLVCKSEPREQNSSSSLVGAVQSSSPLDKLASLPSVENISPLNVRCVKCITSLVTCAVMPCGHCCLCSICGQTVLTLKQVCPVCRKNISTVVAYSHIIYNVYR